MKIMVKYSLRNLLRRKWRTLMTVGGLFLSVFAIILMFSLSRGLSLRSSATGETDNILILSIKGKSVMFSSIEEDQMVNLMQLPGIEQDTNGNLLISPEVMHVAVVDTEDSKYHGPISIRGVKNIALDVHRSVNLFEGKLPEEDYEIIVGKTVYIKMGMPEDKLQVGNTVKFENQDWTICGRFDAENSMLESEIWSKDGDLMTVLKRRTPTFAVINFQNAEAANKALDAFTDKASISRFFKGWIERSYYRDFSKNLHWIVWISFITSVAVLTAAILIGINTMYTSIMNRMREFGTLRVLGFSRRDIVATLVFESIFLSCTSGCLGIAAGMLLDGVPIKIANSAFSLTVDSSVIIIGLSVSILIGFLGALMPSMHILKTAIINALNTRR
jgi:putative ABC transport system permease protein